MMSTRAKVLVAAGALVAFVAILWVAAYNSGAETKVVAPEWSGTMVVQTTGVQVDYDGRATRCVSDDVFMPGHFEVRVTNGGEVPLVCDVVVQEAQVSGYRAGDPSWLRVAPVPAIARQMTGTIPVRALLPSDVPDGEYVLRLLVSKGQQVGTVMVVFDVQRKVPA